MACQGEGFLIAGGMCSLVGGVLLRQVGVHLASKVGRDHYWSVRRAVVVDGVHQYCSPRGAVVLCMRSSIGRYRIVMEVSPHCSYACGGVSCEVGLCLYVGDFLGLRAL